MSPRSESGAPSAAYSSSRPSLRHGLALVLVLVAAVALRTPQLYNASALLNADEAVNALMIKHLFTGRELALQPWDASYYGIVEGLLAVPFAIVWGWSALAFKLAALTGLVVLVVAVYLLGRQLFGPGEGLVAAAVVAAFSPQLVQWSTMATGGSALITAWGTLTFVQLGRVARLASSGRLVLLGLMAGFGLYLYDYFLVFLVAIALWGLIVLAARWKGHAGMGGSPHPRWRARRFAVGAAFLAPGLALGLLPKALLLLWIGPGSKGPSYQLAGAADLAPNLRLMVTEVLPAFFGVDPLGQSTLRPFIGAPWPGSRLLGALLLGLYAAIWGWAAWRAARELVAGRHDRRAPLLALPVLLVPLTGLLVLVAHQPGPLANRFLLPWLASLPVLAGGAVGRLARRSRTLAAGSFLLLTAVPLVQIASWNVYKGYVDERLRPVRLGNSLNEVLRYLDEHRIRGAYAWYWTCYTATMLADERIVVAPLEDWDRHPAYTRAVARLPRVAYIFRTDWKTMDPTGAAASRWRLDAFLNRVESAGARYVMARIGPYEIYHGPRGERLLPPALPDPPVPLATPRAEVVVAGDVPQRVGPGERFTVPVRITNRSDAFWSTSGLELQAGVLRVTASYRWLLPGGEALPIEGDRSLLPGDVRPGQALRMPVRVVAPAAAGTYALRITLVQEGVAWFDQATGSGSERMRFEVR